jgi:serine protease
MRACTLLPALLCALLMALPTSAVAAERPAPPNDPYYSDQWALRSEAGNGVDLLETWRFSQGDDVVVAVLDTGISSHPEFEGRVLPGYDFISDAVRAGDGDGRDPNPSDPGDWVSAADISAQKYGPDCNEHYDSSWHGTHVAGTILAAANNGIGVTGIAPLARLLPVRVLGHCGGSVTDLVDAMRWAGGLSVSGVPENPTPATVINISLVIETSCSVAMQTAVDELSARGVIIVTAVGNENLSASRFSPANCFGTLTVGATTPTGDRASYSNYGSAVDLSAPGGETTPGSRILSTYNEGRTAPAESSYSAEAGTSMAAPHVAGILAAILAAEPNLPRSDLLTLLFANLAPFPAVSECAQNTGLCGGGIINGARLYAAFAARTAPLQTKIAPTELAVGDSAPVSATVDGSAATLTLLTPTVCSFNGGSVTALASGSCILESSHPGSSTIQPVNLQITITVPGNIPSLSLTLPTRLEVGQRITPTVATSSDGVATLASRTPKVCVVGASGRLRAIAKGTCTVRVKLTATAQFSARQITVRVRVTR